MQVASLTGIVLNKLSATVHRSVRFFFYLPSILRRERVNPPFSSPSKTNLYRIYSTTFKYKYRQIHSEQPLSSWNMWSSLLANFKPKSGYHLVLVVVYYLVFTLNVCYSENVTSNAVIPIPNLSKSVNSTNLVLPPLTPTTTTTITTTPTKLVSSTEIPTNPSTIKATTRIAPSILKRLSTIRPNVAPSNSASSSTNGIQTKSSSTTLNTEKVDSRNVRPKPKQTTSQQQQQKQQQSSQYKVLSWPSKPGGTYLIEGDFQYNCHYAFIFLSFTHTFSSPLLLGSLYLDAVVVLAQLTRLFYFCHHHHQVS